MKKKAVIGIIVVVAVIIMIVLVGSILTCAKARGKYTEKELALITEYEDLPDTVTVRFYETMPNVPYIGIAQYKALMQDAAVDVDYKGTRVVLTAGCGASLIVDAIAGTLTSDRWAEFRNNIDGMLNGDVVGFRDCPVPFATIESIEYEPQKEPVVFDLAAYEIPVYIDRDDAYLPLATVNDMMTDIAMNTLVYNEEILCFPSDFFDNGIGVQDYYGKFLEGEPREPDMAGFAYRELCFVMDCLYGCPGTNILDDTISEIGFDRTLAETDELTARIRDCLLSADRNEYFDGLVMLYFYLYDGHTVTYDWGLVGQLAEAGIGWPDDLFREMQEEFWQKDYSSVFDNACVQDKAVAETREEVFGDTSAYHEFGDTAVISFDNFTDYDEEGWYAYYNGEGSMPDGKEMPDLIATVLDGLKRAGENPEIRNVIFDVTNNTGGSSDLLMTVYALITGKGDLRCYDCSTDQYYTIHYAIDSLFDGSFDTSAAYEKTDLNFAVLTTHNSFSCGNAFPEIAKEAGMPIFGETSGGGTCAVILLSLAEGPIGTMSSSCMILIDGDGNLIEDGVPVDASLVQVSADGEKDYSALYDIEGLSELMSEY